ncbi:MAG: AMIN domain-containing protein, partial [Vicinamibacteria bacterium]
MRRVWTLAALPAVALIVGASTARAALIDTPAAHARTDAASAVTALSLVPGQGQAEVVIAVSGHVEVKDFTVPSPHRIVIDLAGARLGPTGKGYDGVARGGITNIRTSQYRTDVVRVVLDVDGPRAYSVSSANGEVRVAIKGNASFAAWHSSGAMLAEAVAAREVTTEVSAGAVATAEPPAEPVKAEADAPDEDSTASLDSIIARATAPVRRLAPADEPAAVRAEQARQQAQQPRITVTWSEADIRDVLAGFAT